jgi:protein TonB
MFSYLVESDLHTGEFKRKGKFFLATMATYALVLMATGVVGVYAYEAHIDDQKNLELVALVPPDTEEVKPKEVEPVRRTNAPPTQANNSGPRNNGGLIKNTPPADISADPTKIAGEAKSSTSQTPPILSTGDRKLDPDSYDAILGGGRDGNGKKTGGNENGGGDSIINEKPPEIKKKEQPEKERIPYVGPVTGRAISLPQPAYPAVAKAANIQGPVTVEILIDEGGRVLAAHATGGHPLLRLEAEKAAYRARFSPTLLQNQPTKVKGVITFNFILGR